MDSPLDLERLRHPGSPDDLMTASDAAVILGLSADMVRILAREGRLAYQQTIRGVRLFRRSDVERLAEQRRELADDVDVMQRLKTETAELHTAVEGVVPLLRPGAGAAEFEWFLAKMYGFVVPIERHLARLFEGDGEPAWMAGRWKTPLLQQDLAALGRSEADLELCARYPRPRSAASMLGCAYVIEGSTLGGRVLLRELDRRCPEALRKAPSYLAGYGPETGSMWRAFGEVVREHARTPRDHQRIVRAARDTFAALHRWLDDGTAPVAEGNGGPLG